MAKKRRIFHEPTPLGYRVFLTRDRWREIVRFKHPIMAGRESAVRDCVHDPDLIRASAKDPDVHLFYRTSGAETVCVVVGGEQASRFVVTAYLTHAPKKGPDLWTK
jgi:hypothetical protein